MNTTRKNWLLVLSLTLIAVLMVFAFFGIIRGGGMTKAIAVIFEICFAWSAYEVILALKGTKKEKEIN